MTIKLVWMKFLKKLGRGNNNELRNNKVSTRIKKIFKTFR